MFSVIIQNQKTTESFEQYRPLFMSALDGEEMALCRWMEGGHDVESALIGLTDIINDKEEWRAVVVNWASDFDEPSDYYATDALNPYDFTVNKDKEARDDYTESVVPLIRLTNILGGVPTCNKAGQDCWQNSDEDSVKAYERYVKRNEEYEALKGKYDENFRKPTEILIVNVRDGNKANEIRIKSKQSNITEYDSSDFWERNLYPDRCRFFIFDMFKGGPVKFDEDEFRFWNTIRILASNEIDPSAVSAYKLYKIDVKINKKELGKCLQDKADKMDGIDTMVEGAIKNERDKILKDLKGIPDYAVEKDVAHGLKGYRFGSTSDDEFKIIAVDGSKEIKKWHAMEDSAEKELFTYAKRINRSLEDIAEEIRDVDTFDIDEVHNMSKFDEENMRSDLEDKYLEILKIQRNIPYKKAPVSKELLEQGEKITDKLRNRLSSATVQNVLAALAASMIIFVIPVLFFLFAGKLHFGLPFVTIILLILLLFAIVILAVMFVYRVKLHSMVSEYNYMHRAEIKKASVDNGVLNNFVSDIATYAKGNSYLEKLLKKKSKINNRYYKYNRHVMAADIFRSLLRKWSIAYGLEVLFNNGFYGKLDYDMDVTPSHNEVFSLENYSNKIEINKSGRYYESPFSYISRFELTREDLYRDDKRN